MIIYHESKQGFQRDIASGEIDTLLLARVRERLGRGVGASEQRSWHQSLTHMGLCLADPGIPDDAGVSIELQIPHTSKRIDVIVSGQDTVGRDQAVIVELKQWESAERTPMDGVVRTALGGGLQNVSHPSYQAWSYASLLRDFNEAVYDGQIALHPCAWLHNYRADGELDHPFYARWTEEAPLFLKGDLERLRAFIQRYVRTGDRNRIVVEMDRGRIRPSKQLADAMRSLMQGNPAFTMIDEQKVAFEQALHLARTTPPGEKRVLVVHGGPGTGKSVVAMQLLAALTEARDLALYVTKNAAPRAVYEKELTGVLTKNRFSNLFKGSGAFVTSDRDTFDTLVVDEAHRLNEKSGLYQNEGENQIGEIIHAARVSVFFLDEDQRVTLKDIGSRGEILKWAAHHRAEVEELSLTSQFRCNGSDGYLAWLDHLLQIRETANRSLADLDVAYDFRVFDDPNALRAEIEALDLEAGRARMVAGYCWDWKSKKAPSAMDVVIPEYGFSMQWNLASDQGLWLVKPESITEIGCIHTCQGLEMDYVGVIIGPDLIVRGGEVVTRPEERSSQDRTIFGWKKALKEDPVGTPEKLRRVILNTYRTLMTRGTKGCFVYATDPETNAWLKEQVGGVGRS